MLLYALAQLEGCKAGRGAKRFAGRCIMVCKWTFPFEVIPVSGSKTEAERDWEGCEASSPPRGAPQIA